MITTTHLQKTKKHPHSGDDNQKKPAKKIEYPKKMAQT